MDARQCRKMELSFRSLIMCMKVTSFVRCKSGWYHCRELTLVNELPAAMYLSS